MTKKDAIKILQCRGNGYSEKDFNDALEMAYDSLSETSLPSNLDEAADKYIQTLCDRADDNLRIDTTLQAAFKAGAEWMTGQGVKTTGKIIPLPTDDRFNWLQVDDDIQLCGILTGFNIGDKVTIQIRKI